MGLADDRAAAGGSPVDHSDDGRIQRERREPSGEHEDRGEEGITDPELLHDCIIGFGITNGFLFTAQYAHQQAVLAARAALVTKATLPAAPAEAVLLMAGTVKDKAPPNEFHFTASAGDVIYIAEGHDCVDRDANWWKGDNSVIYFSLSDPAGNVLATQPGCQMGRVALPATGTYTMTSSQGVGAYRVPIRFVRHDRVRSIA